MSASTSLIVTRLEVVHLTDLVDQFADLVAESSESDPAIDRLTPDPYPDDAEAGAQFRDAARDDLLARRGADAAAVLGDLRTALGRTPPDTSGTDADDIVEIVLDADDVGAWLRTLAAIRLVLASRLGITSEDDRDVDDPRFGVYDWIGYRLEALIQATEPGGQGSGST